MLSESMLRAIDSLQLDQNLANLIPQKPPTFPLLRLQLTETNEPRRLRGQRLRMGTCANTSREAWLPIVNTPSYSYSQRLPLKK